MLKNIIPQKLLKQIRPYYHGAVSLYANYYYGNPSEKIRVIGITGTKGKSSTVYILYQLLKSQGLKVGLSSSIYFSDGNNLIKNDSRNSMPGKFVLHKLISEAVKNKCQVFIVEVTSEGLVQNRHLGIHFDIAGILNLYPEHLDSHGGFNNYKKAKGILFKSLHKSKNKVIKGVSVEKLAFFNQDDNYFKFFYKIGNYKKFKIGKESNDFKTKLLKSDQNGLQFEFGYKEDIHLVKSNLIGEFNILNLSMCLGIAINLGLDIRELIQKIPNLKEIPGRMNVINDRPTVIVDYAHIPVSLEKVYQTLNQVKSKGSKIISVLGSCGGGRDVWKRAKMGRIAGEMTDYTIITDEDPFDEDPMSIIEQVFEGVLQTDKIEGKTAFKILSRKDAFKKALALAKRQDIIIITGKGSENSIVRANGKKENWNDTKEMQKLLS